MSKKTQPAEIAVEDQKFVLIINNTEDSITDVAPKVCHGTEDLFGEIVEYILSEYGEEIEEGDAETIGAEVTELAVGETMVYGLTTLDADDEDVELQVVITRVV